MKVNKNLWKGSFVLLITFNLFFALNYFFHFAMARMLSISDYGVLVVLYSIIYIFGIFTESIQTVISKYTTGEENKGKLKSIFNKSIKKASKIGVYLFILYLLIGVGLSIILDIEYYLIALTGVMLLFTFTLPVGRGFLQGKKRFSALGINMIIESIVKLVVAILLVFAGWKVFGALAATILGVFFSFVMSVVVIKDILKSKEDSADTPDIYGYTKPVFISLLSILLFFNLDVIFARIFFSPEMSGVYAISSTISKIIFFGTQPISKAMFPLATESKKGGEKNVFSNALFILIGAIVAALAVFYFFPDLLVRIYSGRYIVESASILIYTGIAISLLSLTNLIILYKLSRRKIKNSWVFLFFILIQVALFSFFHRNLLEFSLAFVTASVAFLWGSIMFLGRD